MLRTYVYERTYVLLKYDPRLKYPLCYDPQKLPTQSVWNDRLHVVDLSEKTRFADSQFAESILPNPSLPNMVKGATGILWGRMPRKRPHPINKMPIGYIAHLRKQFKLINTFDYYEKKNVIRDLLFEH